MNNYVKPQSTPSAGVSQHAWTTVKDCGCGDKSSGVCSESVYVRPLFFAGQLLTEEDLQSLSGYAAAKNRLHNRHFFGEGVVCGLDVTCHPCDAGKVVVAPGYALDCCGNDIVLACRTELDINAMVRELRVQLLGGYDCGDPCTEKSETLSGHNNKKYNGGDKLSSRRYCLYIRYCEQPADFVTPYGTDEPCVKPGCEPTRVREGVRFELRCSEEGKAPNDDLFVRLRRCLGDLLSAKTTAVEAPWLLTYASQIANAKRNIQARYEPEFDANKLGAARSELEKVAALFSKEPSRLHALDVLGATLDVTSWVARFLSLHRTDELIQNFRKEAYQEDTSLISEAFAQIDQKKIDEILQNYPLERIYAKALFAVAKDVLKKADLLFHPPEQDQGVATSPEYLVAQRYLAESVVLHHDLLYTASGHASAVRNWLLCQLDQTRCSTDCSLRDDVLCVSLSGLNPNALADSAAAYSAPTLKLRELLSRYLRECLCCALNPPCPPCEDAAVVLACLEVENCKVESICNLERKFVPTPMALRYWLPPLRLLGEVIEKLCCQPSHLKGESIDKVQLVPRTSPIDILKVPSNSLARLFSLSNYDDAQALFGIYGALLSVMGSEGMLASVLQSFAPLLGAQIGVGRAGVGGP